MIPRHGKFVDFTGRELYVRDGVVRDYHGMIVKDASSLRHSGSCLCGVCSGRETDPAASTPTADLYSKVREYMRGHGTAEIDDYNNTIVFDGLRYSMEQWEILKARAMTELQPPSGDKADSFRPFTCSHGRGIDEECQKCCRTPAPGGHNYVESNRIAAKVNYILGRNSPTTIEIDYNPPEPKPQRCEHFKPQPTGSVVRDELLSNRGEEFAAAAIRRSRLEERRLKEQQRLQRIRSWPICPVHGIVTMFWADDGAAVWTCEGER